MLGEFREAPFYPGTLASLPRSLPAPEHARRRAVPAARAGRLTGAEKVIEG